MPAQVFPGKIFIKEKSRVSNLAKNNQADFILWCNGSKLAQGDVGTVKV